MPRSKLQPKNDNIHVSAMVRHLKARISELHVSLEGASDPIAIHRTQGSIQELRSMQRDIEGVKTKIPDLDSDGGPATYA